MKREACVPGTCPCAHNTGQQAETVRIKGQLTRRGYFADKDHIKAEDKEKEKTITIFSKENVRQCVHCSRTLVPATMARLCKRKQFASKRNLPERAALRIKTVSRRKTQKESDTKPDAVSKEKSEAM